MNILKVLLQTAPLAHPESYYRQAKYCMRGLAFARHTKAWCSLLQNPDLAVVIKSHPHVFQKLQRPYLDRRLNIRQRFELLYQHYHFVLAHFPPGIMERVYTPPGKLLAALTLAEVGQFELRLSFSRHRREGDLMVDLLNQQTGAVMFSIVFSITQSEVERREIFIGGLQGNKLANDQKLITAMTRSLHGLRPKALLLFVLQQFALIFRIKRLRAVSDERHVFRHWLKRKEIASSYDQWWLDAGGKLASDGIFDLPPFFVPRDILSLNVNKRQMYKRRYLMLGEIADQIQAALLQTEWSEIPAARSI